PHAHLGIDCGVSTSDAYVTLDLEFDWGPIHIHPSFTLDAKQIANLLASLWENIKTWIDDHLSAFFDQLLKDVKVWVNAIASGFLWAKQTAVEIAKVLYNVFSITKIEDLAAELVKITQLAFDDVAQALVTLFKISLSEAVRVLKGLGATCAM